MYSKKRTLADKFTLTNKKIDLPRDAVIDRIMARFSVTLTNADDTDAYTGHYYDILQKLTDLRIVSDGNNVHYAVTAEDIALLNFYDNKGVTVNPDTEFTAAKDTTTTLDFMLVFDEGDILAITKDSLEFSFDLSTTSINADPAVTITALTGTITIEENVYTTPEFQATYGPSLELAAEPKIVAIEKSFDSSDELREFFDMPTGTLLRRAFLVSKSAAGVRGGVTPSKMGILVTTPDRREVYTIDYATLRDYNKMAYALSSLVNGVAVIDFGSEITCDEFGIRGWKFNKGDYQMGIKSATAGKLRYLSVEYVVNTHNFDAVQRAMMEGTL